MKKYKLFKGVTIGAFALLYLVSGYFGLASAYTYEISPIGIVLSALFVVSFFALTFFFSGSKTYLVLFSAYFILLGLSIVAAFIQEYVFYSSVISGLFNIILYVLLSFSYPIMPLFGKLKIISVLYLDSSEAIVLIAVYAVIIALFYVVFFATKPLKRKLFPDVNFEVKKSTSLSKKGSIINRISVLLLLVLYFVTLPFSVADFFGSYNNFSAFGVIISVVFLLYFYIVTYRLSNNKGYITAVSVYFGLAVLAVIFLIITDALHLHSDITSQLQMILGIICLSYVLPAIYPAMSLGKIISVPKLNYFALIVGSTVITMVLFYVVLFVSRRIKRKRKERELINTEIIEEEIIKEELISEK